MNGGCGRRRPGRHWRAGDRDAGALRDPVAPSEPGWPRCLRSCAGACAGRANRRGRARHGVPDDIRRGIAHDERVAGSHVDSGRVDHVHVDVPASEPVMRHDGPRVPGIVAVAAIHIDAREAEHRAVVPPERAPAHIARGVRPGHPRGSPRAARNPEPRPRRRSPIARSGASARPRDPIQSRSIPTAAASSSGRSSTAASRRAHADTRHSRRWARSAMTRTH